jgi:hypothetical protein
MTHQIFLSIHFFLAHLARLSRHLAQIRRKGAGRARKREAERQGDREREGWDKKMELDSTGKVV